MMSATMTSSLVQAPVVSTLDAPISPLCIRGRCAAHLLSYARRLNPTASVRAVRNRSWKWHPNAAEHAMLLAVQVSRRPVARSARSPMVVRASQETSRRGALSALAGGEPLRCTDTISAAFLLTSSLLAWRIPTLSVQSCVFGCARQEPTSSGAVQCWA